MTQPANIGPQTLVDEGDFISPTWWNGPNGKRLRYSMAVMFDGVDQALMYAIQAQAPSLAPVDAFPYLSADRRIVQGFQEPVPSFRARLAQWLDRAPYRGKSVGILLGARGWILSQLPEMSVVDQVGQWWTYQAGVDPMPPGTDSLVPATVVTGTTWNWDGNGATLWARSWLVIFATGVPWCTQGPNWGAGNKWGDGRAWGFAQGPATFAGLPGLVLDWKNELVRVPNVIVSFSDAWFQPTSSSGDLPDGNYGQWYKIVNGNYVASRTSNACYLPGAS